VVARARQQGLAVKHPLTVVRLTSLPGLGPLEAFDFIESEFASGGALANELWLAVVVAREWLISFFQPAPV